MGTLELVLVLSSFVIVGYVIGGLFKLSDDLIKQRELLKKKLANAERRVEILELINDSYIKIFKLKNNIK